LCGHRLLWQRRLLHRPQLVSSWGRECADPGWLGPIHQSFRRPGGLECPGDAGRGRGHQHRCTLIEAGHATVPLAVHNSPLDDRRGSHGCRIRPGSDPHAESVLSKKALFHLRQEDNERNSSRMAKARVLHPANQTETPMFRHMERTRAERSAWRAASRSKWERGVSHPWEWVAPDPLTPETYGPVNLPQPTSPPARRDDATHPTRSIHPSTTMTLRLSEGPCPCGCPARDSRSEADDRRRRHELGADNVRGASRPDLPEPRLTGSDGRLSERQAQTS